jgi:hydroxymethylbilane synthase
MVVQNKIVVGSRGSKLALWQSNLVVNELGKLVSSEIVIERIRTTGDKILDSPLAKIGDKGLFVKEIEVALSEHRIDLAVHSMKDMPTDVPSDLIIGAILKREDPHDVLLSKNNLGLAELAQNAVIGTSSLRRKAQLLRYRSDLSFTDVRGNLDTRIRKMDAGQFDGMILAAAGIKRMGWAERISEIISSDICLSAVGQGAIGIEIRKEDTDISDLVGRLNDEQTSICVGAERALMKYLEGGCQVPIGALAEIEGEEFNMQAMVASLDGERLVKKAICGDPEQAESLAIDLAKMLLSDGASEILEEIRAALP